MYSRPPETQNITVIPFRNLRVYPGLDLPPRYSLIDLGGTFATGPARASNPGIKSVGKF